MFFSPFIALRYLKPKRTYVSIITLISILGVALGVFIHTIVIAVFTGFGEKYQENILGMDAHLQISPVSGIMTDFTPTYFELEKFEPAEFFTPYVMGPVIMDFEGKRMVPVIRAINPPEAGSSYADALNSKIAEIKNPNYDPEGDVNEPKTIRAGEFYLDPETAVIGVQMAKNLDIEIGDTLKFYSPSIMNEVAEIMDAINKGDESRKKELEEFNVAQFTKVSGFFDSGNPEVDANFIYLHLETGQILYDFETVDAHGIAIRTEDAFQAAEYKDQLMVQLGMGKEETVIDNAAMFALKKTFNWVVIAIISIPILLLIVLGAFLFRDKLSKVVVSLLIGALLVFAGFWLLNFIDARGQTTRIVPIGFNFNQIQTWADLNKILFDAIALERQMMHFILMAVLIVAGFCISNTMVTITYQKRSEIGLMKALGATESQIVWLFIIKGMIVGFIGVIVGLVFGKLTLLYRNEIADFLGRNFGVQMFSSEAYSFKGGLPAVHTWQDALNISIAAFIACTVAAAIPAIIAANLQPAKALRSE